MNLFLLLIFTTPNIIENRDDLIKKYNIKSPLLQGNTVEKRENNLGKQRHLIQMNLLEDPVIIERFTKSVVHEYYGDDKDGFADVYPIMIMNTPIGKVSFIGDPVWVRIVWGWEESANFYSFGSFGSGDGEFKGMGDIDGKYPDLFITDTWNHRIQHWRVEIDSIYVSLQGKWIKFIREIEFVKSFGEGNLSIPEGLDYSDNGTPEDTGDDLIYVADMKSLIVKFKTDGTFMGSFGEQGRRRNGKGYFGGPGDIVVGKEDGINTKEIYVLDCANNCIVNYPDGVDISSPEFYWNTYKYPEASEFSLYTIDVDYFGYPYVGDSKSRIVKYTKDLVDTLWSYGSYGFGEGHFNYIHDIYIYQDELLATERWTDSSGISYYWIEGVTDTESPVVKILSPPDKTYVNGEIKIVGTVKDDYLKYWQVYTGEGAYPDEFELIEVGTGDKECAVLTSLNTSGKSEIVSILLLARDEGGNISTDTVRIWVGEPPVDLSISKIDRKSCKCCMFNRFKFPLDVCVDDGLNIYVSDTYRRLIHKFDPEGSFLFSFSNYGRGKCSFKKPRPRYPFYPFRVFFPHIYYGRVKCGFLKPAGIASRRDKIYIADLLNRQIQVFDTSGSYLYMFNVNGSKHYKFNQSEDLVLQEDDSIDIQVFVDTSDSSLDEVIGNERKCCKFFNLPFDIALHEESDVYVSDRGRHIIQKFTEEGDYVSSFGSFGDSIGEFNNPCGIDIIGNQIAVSDRENDRVQILSLSGEAKRIIESEFDRPYDVGFDSDTSLYVVDCNMHRVQKFDRFGNHLLTIYDNSLKLPMGCEVSDALYISDTHNNRILKFRGWFSLPGMSRFQQFETLVSRKNSLSCVYPNPCSKEVKIYMETQPKLNAVTQSLESTGSPSFHSVQLDIYNIAGRRIKELFDGEINTSQYLFNWDLRDNSGNLVPSGIYFYRLRVDSKQESKKIVVVR